MKLNKTLLLITIASLTAITSCDSNTNSNTSSTTSNDVIQNNIDTFSKGFLMNGVITQTRYVAIGIDSSGNYIFSSEAETNTYKTSIGFENNTRNGYTKYSTQEYDWEDQVIENYTYFEDEDGYTYKENLNYKNEIERDYTINQSQNSFEYNGFYNFFSILNKADFEKENDTCYYLDQNKAGIISNNLLYSLNSGFATNVKEAYFDIENNVFSKFTINMEDYLYLDSSSTSYLYKVVNSAVFTFSNIGTYTIDTAKKYDAKNYTSLQNGLNAISKNYTMHVKINSLNQATSSNSISYEDYYFTGDKIYVHTYLDETNSSPDYSSDYYLASEENGGVLYSYTYDEATSSFIKNPTTSFPSLYQGLFTYEDYLPNVGEVSADLFKYDDTSKSYKGEDNAISALTDCFYLKKVPFKKSAANSFTDIEIKLDNDSISSVTLPFSYTDFMEGEIVTGTYEITYSNIGTTEIPTL